MRIAIVKLSAMGDIIHAMLALQFIKKNYPDAIIDWFVENSFSKVLENNPDISNIFELDLKSIKKKKSNLFLQIKLIRQYSKNNYDLVLDAQGLIKSAIVSKLLGKNIVGFDRKSTREGLASFFYTQKISSKYEKNVIERNLDILCKSLKIEISRDDILNKKAFLFFKNEDKKICEYFIEERKNILLIVGASWPSKMYSKEKFAKIICSINENFIIAWGNEEEKNIAEYISSNTSAKVLPKLDLNTLKAVIARSDLVIGNDTGPTHMAWALNIPSITIFGCTPGYRNTYVSEINRIVESHSKVDPFKLNRNDFSIQEVDEQKIINISRELLNG